MKHTFLTSVVLLIVATTTGSAQNRYTITGYLTNQANAEIKLSYRESGRPVTASVYATNGSFTLSGPAPSRPVVATLNTGVDRNIHLGLSKRSMFVAPPPLTFVLTSNSHLTVSGSAAGIHLAKVEGDEFNRAFNELRQVELPHTQESDRLRQEFADIKITGNDDQLKELGPKMLKNRHELAAVQKQFINGHPTALASVWLLARMEKDYEPEEYKKAFETLAPELQCSEFGQQVAAAIESPSTSKNPKAASSSEAKSK